MVYLKFIPDNVYFAVSEKPKYNQEDYEEVSEEEFNAWVESISTPPAEEVLESESL